MQSYEVMTCVQRILNSPDSKMKSRRWGLGRLLIILFNAHHRLHTFAKTPYLKAGGSQQGKKKTM